MDAFLGEIRPFSGQTKFLPAGWVFCDGSVINITDNEQLYALIGTRFGGNGTTTFALPDLRGRLPIGQGNGSGLSPRSLGQYGGSELTTLVEAHIPTHSHAFMASTDPANTNSPKDVFFANPTPNVFYAEMPSPPVPVLTLTGDTLAGSGGGNQPHENRMPAMAINYIMCMNGIFPTKP